MDQPQTLTDLCTYQVALSFKKLYDLRKGLQTLEQQLAHSIGPKEELSESACLKLRRTKGKNAGTIPEQSRNSTCTDKSTYLLQYISNINKSTPFIPKSFYSSQSNFYSNLILESREKVADIKDEASFQSSANTYVSHRAGLDNSKLTPDHLSPHILNYPTQDATSLAPTLRDIRDSICCLIKEIQCHESNIINDFIFHHPGPVLNDAILAVLDRETIFTEECLEWFLRLLINLPTLFENGISRYDKKNANLKEILKCTSKVSRLVLRDKKIDQDLLQDILSRKDWISTLTRFDIFKSILPTHHDVFDDHAPPSPPSVACGDRLHPDKHLAHIFSYLRSLVPSHRPAINVAGLEVLNLGPLNTDDLLQAYDIVRRQAELGGGAGGKSFFKPAHMRREKEYLPLFASRSTCPFFYPNDGNDGASTKGSAPYGGIRALIISELVRLPNQRRFAFQSESDSDTDDGDDDPDLSSPYDDDSWVREYRASGAGPDREVSATMGGDGHRGIQRFKFKRLMELMGDATASLVYLELNNADYLNGSQFCYLLNHVTNLTHLVLHNSFNDDALDAVISLENLEFLDISNSYPSKYHDRKHIMTCLLHLEKLRGLDISGTDLAGEIGSSTKSGQRSTYLTSFRKCKRRFDFLGLHNTPKNVCQCTNIPADLVTGDANEDQILLSMEVYGSRSEAIQKATTDLFLLFRYSSVRDKGRALENVLVAMKEYESHVDILIACSACLFYLIKTDFKKGLSILAIQRVINAVLRCIENYPNEKNMVRNCLLTLFHFNIPDQIMFAMTRTIKVLLVVLTSCIAKQNLASDAREAAHLGRGANTHVITAEPRARLSRTDVVDASSLQPSSVDVAASSDIVAPRVQYALPYDMIIEVGVTGQEFGPSLDHFLEDGTGQPEGDDDDDDDEYLSTTFTEDEELADDDPQIDASRDTQHVLIDNGPESILEDELTIDDDHLIAGGALDYLDELVQRLSICVLNSLVCVIDTQQKRAAGQGLGAIRVILSLIRARVRRSLCDEVLEVAWSTLWNITDETAENCGCFLRENGMELFLLCLKKFQDRPEVYRNMLGLLGNISEVPTLRPLLMKDEYVQVFYELLYNFLDGIEIAYNAAGIISHLLSDGPDAWNINLPRAQVLTRLPDTIHRWSIDSKRNINYRSLEPILRLLKHFQTPQVQHWSVWALGNLTKVYPDKYCQLLVTENGESLLREIISDPRPYTKIKQLATFVLSNIETFEKRKSKSFSRNSSFTTTDGNQVD